MDAEPKPTWMYLRRVLVRALQHRDIACCETKRVNLMNLQGKKITVHDMCLRDGMHPKQHQITVEQMVTISKAMDDAGVPLIELWLPRRQR